MNLFKKQKLRRREWTYGYEGEGRERAIDWESRNTKRESQKIIKTWNKIQFQLKEKIEEARNTV